MKILLFFFLFICGTGVEPGSLLLMDDDDDDDCEGIDGPNDWQGTQSTWR
jgi:hypothetical protein